MTNQKNVVTFSVLILGLVIVLLDHVSCKSILAAQCESDQFVCDETVCIEKSHVCDNISHCNDLSDESGCDCITMGKLSCGMDGHCVSHEDYCNKKVTCHQMKGQADCVDDIATTDADVDSTTTAATTDMPVTNSPIISIILDSNGAINVIDADSEVPEEMEVVQPTDMTPVTEMTCELQNLLSCDGSPENCISKEEYCNGHTECTTLERTMCETDASMTIRENTEDEHAVDHNKINHESSHVDDIENIIAVEPREKLTETAKEDHKFPMINETIADEIDIPVEILDEHEVIVTDMENIVDNSVVSRKEKKLNEDEMVVVEEDKENMAMSDNQTNANDNFNNSINKNEEQEVDMKTHDKIQTVFETIMAHEKDTDTTKNLESRVSETEMLMEKQDQSMGHHNESPTIHEETMHDTIDIIEEEVTTPQNEVVSLVKQSETIKEQLIPSHEIAHHDNLETIETNEQDDIEIKEQVQHEQTMDKIMNKIDGSSMLTGGDMHDDNQQNEMEISMRTEEPAHDANQQELGMINEKQEQTMEKHIDNMHSVISHETSDIEHEINEDMSENLDSTKGDVIVEHLMHSSDHENLTVPTELTAEEVEMTEEQIHNISHIEEESTQISEHPDNHEVEVTTMSAKIHAHMVDLNNEMADKHEISQDHPEVTEENSTLPDIISHDTHADDNLVEVIDQGVQLSEHLLPVRENNHGVKLNNDTDEAEELDISEKERLDTDTSENEIHDDLDDDDDRLNSAVKQSLKLEESTDDSTIANMKIYIPVVVIAVVLVAVLIAWVVLKNAKRADSYAVH